MKIVQTATLAGMTASITWAICSLLDIIASKSSNAFYVQKPMGSAYLSHIFSAISIIQLVAFTVVMISMAIILRSYKAYFTIYFFIYLYICWQFFMSVIYVQHNNIVFLGTVAAIGGGLMCCLVILLFFVKDKRIGVYFKWYSVSLIVTFLLRISLPWLYDHIGLRWALVQPQLIGIIPYIVVFILFLRVYTANKQAMRLQSSML